MNERIRELENQAIEYSWNQRNTELDLDAIMREKFAELIVRECANVGERYADGNYEVYNQILKRFGMEEE